jgi:hypothetical protein
MLGDPGRLAPKAALLTELVGRRAGGRPEPDERRPVRPSTAARPPIGPDPTPDSKRPRFGYELTFFARLTANLRAEVLGETPDGFRINFYVKGGSISGPEIDAVIRPEGGDWMCIRPDGVGVVDIDITYDTTDGALILEQAGGVFQLGVDGLARVKRGEFVGSPPFYATPKWVTASPTWSRLNGLQGFGIGRVVLETLQVQCDIYHPRVGASLEP